MAASTAPVGEWAKQDRTPLRSVTAGPPCCCSGMSMSASNCQLTADGAARGILWSGFLSLQPPTPGVGGADGVRVEVGSSVGVAGGTDGSPVGCCSVGPTTLGEAGGWVAGVPGSRAKTQTSTQTTTAPTTIAAATKPRSCQKLVPSPPAS